MLKILAALLVTFTLARTNRRRAPLLFANGA